jgi:hypothetical protein
MSESKSKVVTKKLKAPKAVEFSAQEKSAQVTTTKSTAVSVMGRPSDYTDELAIEICFRIVNGESLNRICKDDHMPNVATVYRWLQKLEDFRNMYTRAKEDQADTLADEIQDISDEKPMMTIVTDDESVEKLDPVGINRNRLRIDARKWIAAKLKPRKYGDRQILAGDAENPLEIKQKSEILEALLINIQLTRQVR